MYGINPISELNKVLALADEPAAAPAPAPAPAAPKPVTLAEGKQDADKLADKLILDSIDLLVSDGKSVTQAINQLWGSRPKPAQAPKPQLPPTERELELAEQAAQARRTNSAYRHPVTGGVVPPRLF